MEFYIGIGEVYQIKPHSTDEFDDVMAFIKDLDGCEIVQVIDNAKSIEIIFKCYNDASLSKIGYEFELYIDPVDDLPIDSKILEKVWSENEL